MTFSVASSASCNERRMCAVDTPSHRLGFVICHRHRARPIFSNKKKGEKNKKATGQADSKCLTSSLPPGICLLTSCCLNACFFPSLFFLSHTVPQPTPVRRYGLQAAIFGSSRSLTWWTCYAVIVTVSVISLKVGGKEPTMNACGMAVCSGHHCGHHSIVLIESEDPSCVIPEENNLSTTTWYSIGIHPVSYLATRP